MIYFLPIRRDQRVARDLGVRRERLRIPSRDPGRYIIADLYDANSSLSTPRPVLVNWHGSGFMFPMLGSDVLFCSRIARDTGALVLDADYRKAPEAPFPGPMNDAEDVLRWIASQSGRFDAKRVAVSGFSAGANLALVAASALRKTLADLVTMVAVTVLYPPVDFSIMPAAKTLPGVTPPPVFMVEVMYDAYAPGMAPYTDPCLSPALADPADFPPNVAILACEADYLAPEDMALARKLEDGRETVISRVLGGVDHGFDKGARRGTADWERREEAYALISEMLKKAFAGF
ncbi:alpha/beta-hydrolase [Thozetella sp. PMI_491]|nr:alpha/beta-hydrolase [Thozetella sp. PMI_491]